MLVGLTYRTMLKVFVLIVVFTMTSTVPTPYRDPKPKYEFPQGIGAFDKILKINAHRKPGYWAATIQDAESPSISDSVELFQGDIVMTKEIRKALKEGGTDEIVIKPRKKGKVKRAATSNEDKKWPIKNGYREVPYVIEHSNADDQKVIKTAMAQWSTNVPCIKFVQRTDQSDYISFFSGRGCYSLTGRETGKQVISIGPDCVSTDIVLHEIAHALGFWHEQSRPDRDNYIKILWNNIEYRKDIEFTKIIGETADLGVPYDYDSIMHYGPKDFAKDPSLNTMVKPQDGSTDFGKGTALSSGDIEQARRLYCPGTVECPNFYTDYNVTCRLLAIQGHCKDTTSTYREFMETHCKKSCICGTCDDIDRNCPFYIQHGQWCMHSGVQFYCRKGCNACS